MHTDLPEQEGIQLTLFSCRDRRWSRVMQVLEKVARSLLAKWITPHDRMAGLRCALSCLDLQRELAIATELGTGKLAKWPTFHHQESFWSRPAGLLLTAQISPQGSSPVGSLLSVWREFWLFNFHSITSAKSGKTSPITSSKASCYRPRSSILLRIRPLESEAMSVQRRCSPDYDDSGKSCSKATAECLQLHRQRA